MPITNIQDLIKDDEAMGKFKASSFEGQILALEQISPEFKSGSQTARNIVVNKILSTPVKDTSGDSDVPLEWKDVPLEAFKNIPSSSLRFGKDIWQAVRHPVQTAKAVGEVALGGIQKAIPGEQGSEQSFDATVEFFKDRYGGLEQLKNTITTDPIGFLNDVSIVFTGGSSIATKAVPLSKAAKIASTASKFIDPVTGITKGASLFAAKGVPRASRSFVQSVIKPTISSKFTPAQKLTRTEELTTAFITKNLRLKRKSVNKLVKSIDANQEVINNVLREGSVKGKATARIDIEPLLSATTNITDELDIFFKNKKIKTDISRLKKFRDEIRADIRTDMITGKRLATPQQLQKFKLFQNKKYAPNVETATTALQKVFDDELRKAVLNKLVDDFPQLKKLNKEQGVSIELKNAIEKAILTREGSPTISVKGLVAGGGGATAGALVGGAEKSVPRLITQMLAFGAGSVTIERIITSPTLQIKIARAINHANTLLAKQGKLGTITTPAFQAGRIATEQQDTNRRTNRNKEAQ